MWFGAIDLIKKRQWKVADLASSGGKGLRLHSTAQEEVEWNGPGSQENQRMSHVQGGIDKGRLSCRAQVIAQQERLGSV